MAARARVKYIPVPPRKARLVADLVRGKGVNEATSILAFTNKKSAPYFGKLLKSAISNATADGKVDADNLYIQEIMVDQGPVLKRFMSRAMGRATPKKGRLSHITMVLGER